MIDKDGVLAHGSIYLTRCSLKKHCCITVRFFCPFCFEEDNVLTPLFKCRRCETSIEKIDVSDSSYEQKLLQKAAIICNHKEKTVSSGFPIQTVASQLICLYKYDLLLSLPFCTVDSQFQIIEQSVMNDRVNSYSSINRLYTFSDLGLYSLSSMIANFHDNHNVNRIKSSFLEEEARYCESLVLPNGSECIFILLCLLYIGNEKQDENENQTNEKKTSKATQPTKTYNTRKRIIDFKMLDGESSDESDEEEESEESSVENIPHVNSNGTALCITVDGKEIPYSIEKILEKDKDVLNAYATFFHDDVEDIKKNPSLYYIRYKLFFSTYKSSKELKPSFGEGSIFANQIFDRLSSIGQEQCKKGVDDTPNYIDYGMTSLNNSYE